MKKRILSQFIMGIGVLFLSGNMMGQIPPGYDVPLNIKDPAILRCLSDLGTAQFNIGKKWQLGYEGDLGHANQQYNGFSVPLVGDLNGDKVPEVVALGCSNIAGTDLHVTASRIDIIDGPTGTIKKSISLASDDRFHVSYYGFHGSPSYLALTRGSDGVGRIILVAAAISSGAIALSTGKIICYKIAADLTPTEEWRTTYSAVVANFTYSMRYPVPYVADFDGDGKPELLVYNKIYDIENSGQLLLTIETLVGTSQTYNEATNANVGAGRRSQFGTTEMYDSSLGFMGVVDFDGDGKPEIAAGHKLYKLNIVKGGTSTYTVYRCASKFGDAFTAVADVTGDGKLDIIALSTPTSNSSSSFNLNVWSPYDSNGDLTNNAPIIASQTINFFNRSSQGCYSVPFIGDINGKADGPGGKRLPEICITTGEVSRATAQSIGIHPTSPGLTDNNFPNALTMDIYGHVCALTFDATETDNAKKFKFSWLLEHKDASIQTGITVFDFTNSGIQQLVYRDESSLRIISGAQDFIALGDNNATLYNNTNIRSYTGFEFPVLADVNGDYQVDILCFGGTGGTAAGLPGSADALYCFDGAGSAFTPSPAVWNQLYYYPLSVKDDLSPVSMPIPITTEFPKTVGGNTTYITPYNGNLLQQAIVRLDNYIPVVPTPDAVIQNFTIPTATTTAATFTFDVRNTGDAAIPASTPVAIYTGLNKDGSGKTFLGTQTLGYDIIEGTLRTITFANVSGNFLNTYVFLEITSDGTQCPAPRYYECEPADNIMPAAFIQAVNDTRNINRGAYLSIDVLTNDYKVCGDNDTQIIVVSQSNPSLGRYVVNGSTIAYRAGSTNGTDIITYKIVCDGNTSNEATVTITISGTDPVVTAYTWNGSASSDWGNAANWTPAGRPDYNSSVAIPSNSSNYPDLKEADLAICKSVKFEVGMNLAPGKDQFTNGAEIAKPMYLTYTTAQVELVLPRDRWNMVSPPLRDMYSGDYVLDGTRFRMIPATVYAKDYASSNLNPGASGATWSIPHKTLDAPLGLGNGLAIWVDYSYDESDSGGKFVFPSDSTKYCYYGMDPAYPMTYNKITNESGTLTRTNAARFIYEGALSTPLDTAFNMPVAHGMEPSFSSVMVGNPFMSHLDYVQLRNNNLALGNSFNIMNATVGSYTAKDNLETYMVLPNNEIMLAGGSIIPGFKISPMQSFLAARNGNATFSTVAFGPSVSVTAPGIGLRSASSTVDELTYFNVKIDKDGSQESAITIMYRSTASNGFVNNEDAMVTINQESTTATLYSRVDDETTTGALAAFNVIGDLGEPVELGVRSKNGGTYRFNFYDMNLFSVAREIWLEDKDNTDTDGNPYRQNMTTNPVYDFSIGSGYTNNRFFIHFGRISTGVEKPAEASNISIFAANDRVTIASPSSDLIRQVEVLNLQGQTVAIRGGLNQDYLTMTLPAQEAVYIVKVTTQKSQKTQKVFIK